MQYSQNPTESAHLLARFLDQHKPVTALTGAGLSTGSGIPDYRDQQGAWKRPQPVQHQEFMTSAATRQRYWARSLAGWPALRDATPNPGHQALAQLEEQGLIGTIITQNVDGLHQRAGSQQVINLHGYANDILCMGCAARSPRTLMHERCLALNPDFDIQAAAIGPDGDADLASDTHNFRVPDCPNCGGILKPDVVYFGDNVPKTRVQQARDALAQSGGLWVIGSSLMVFSGFRFCRYANQAGQPIALLNLGRTRADELAQLKLDTDLLHTLSALVNG